MKNSWIKTSETLPVLVYIDEHWSMSRAVLVSPHAEVATIAYLNKYDDKYEWTLDNAKHPLEYMKYWQPVNTPSEAAFEFDKIRDNLRATQNYRLNT